MIQLVGVPSFAGALYPGTEETPDVLRQHGLQQVLEQSGLYVSDLGNIALPANLPRHNMPPVRNWPAPRMVWEATIAQGDAWFDRQRFNLLLGGDCSMIVGVVDHLAKVYGDKLYLLVIDAHVDVVQPEPTTCVGAAAMGLWFLVNENLLWQKPATINPEQITVLACQNPPAETYGITTIPLEQLLDNMPEMVTSILAGIPDDGVIFIHFDVDAIGKAEMPAAYAPSETGLTIATCQQLLTELIVDPRTIGMEVTEFSVLNDADGRSARSLTTLLSEVIGAGLKARKAGAIVL